VIKVSDFLSPRRIRIIKENTDKQSILELSAGILTEDEPSLKNEELLELFIKREEEFSTGLGGGVALPHAFSGKTDSVKAALLIIPEGADFNSLDGEPVNFVFALSEPESYRSEHVNILMDISRIMMIPGIKEELLDAGSSEDVINIISRS
jgi:mannitol/fructose-specific phosphotransferase system IIA component (Ntr-type)